MDAPTSDPSPHEKPPQLVSEATFPLREVSFAAGGPKLSPALIGSNLSSCGAWTVVATQPPHRVWALYGHKNTFEHHTGRVLALGHDNKTEIKHVALLELHGPGGGEYDQRRHPVLAVTTEDETKLFEPSELKPWKLLATLPHSPDTQPSGCTAAWHSPHDGVANRGNVAGRVETCQKSTCYLAVGLGNGCVSFTKAVPGWTGDANVAPNDCGHLTVSLAPSKNVKAHRSAVTVVAGTPWHAPTSAAFFVSADAGVGGVDGTLVFWNMNLAPYAEVPLKNDCATCITVMPASGDDAKRGERAMGDERGVTIIVGCSSGMVRVFFDTGVCWYDFAAHSQWVSAISCKLSEMNGRPDLVASVGEDGELALWTHPVSQRLVNAGFGVHWVGHTELASRLLVGVAFSEDGNQIYCSQFDNDLISCYSSNPPPPPPVPAAEEKDPEAFGADDFNL